MRKVKLHPDNHIEIGIMLGQVIELCQLIEHLARKAVEDRWKAQGKQIDTVELNNAARAYQRENKWRLRAEAEAILSQTWDLRQ
jgi:hypothetical protein